MRNLLHCTAKYLYFSLALLALLALPVSSWAIGNCPPVGLSSSCSVLITINPDGSLKVKIDPAVPPFDGVEDILVGVYNNSGATVFGVSLTGSDIFGFDGDGPIGGSYAGPGTSFTVVDYDNGIVNFTSGLDNGNFIWFALEGQPSALKQSATITVDPGHGTNCPSVGQLAGTVGNVVYPPSNPPAGALTEDSLTVVTALKLKSLLETANFKVAMTKTDVASCPTLRERGAMANANRTNLLVSVHYDRPRRFPVPFQTDGSLGISNSAKSSAATLAQKVAERTSSLVGVNNRGAKTDDTLALLKSTVSRMTAVIIEVGRLSNPDSDIIHTPGATARAAAGIKGGVDEFLNQ